MSITSPEVYAHMPDRTKAKKYTYPAINCTYLQTNVAAILGFVETESAGIV
jgi:fructose/tagatose bisphosphate aldolase